MHGAVRPQSVNATCPRAAIGRLAGALSALLLSACGGGGGGGPGPVVLQGKNDVAREIVNVKTLYVGEVGTMAAAARAGAGARSMDDWRPHARGVSPKAAETYPCPTSGSLTYEDFYSVTRSLPLFAVNPTVDYYYQSYNNCRYESDGIYFDGRIESGGNGSYASGTAEDPFYSYVRAGSGGRRFVQHEYDSVESVTFSDRGRKEWRDDGAGAASGAILGRDFERQYPDHTIALALEYGESGSPLFLVDNYAAGTGRIDGPFAYATNFCAGGRVEYATVEELVFTTDAEGTYISDGMLMIESGKHSVVLTFLGDGTVQFQLDNGTNGQITRAELDGGLNCQVDFRIYY